MSRATRPQSYPRITDERSEYVGFLDESQLQAHSVGLDQRELRTIILRSIEAANAKSSRAILNVPDGLSANDASKLYRGKGRELFRYFVKYCGDPASTAHQCLHQHYADVAREQFRNRTLQKERMNSGWRYQFIAKDAAIASGRFASVSDLNSNEADFNAVIAHRASSAERVNVYVSVKNRSNTLGGQDWPKAISALEEVAKNDRNRRGPYICVFGIAIEGGMRSIRAEQKTKRPYSVNTEIWLADFFWPFFSGQAYAKIIEAVVSVLLETQRPDSMTIEVPSELVEAFGEACRKYDLLDESGRFHDAFRLASLLVSGTKGLKGR